jgi:hypothetical protein
MNNTFYVVLSILVFITVIFIMLTVSKKEGLSLSQFPVPTCSTCKSCKFYTCGKCGTYFQLQNKIGQSCDCGGFTVYRTPVEKSCYGQTLKGLPNVGPVQTCAENFTNSNDDDDKSSCSSCCNEEYTCMDAAGTFDSGSTWLRNLACPVPFPPVLPGYKIEKHKQSRHVSELDIYKHLEKGGLVVAANDGDIVEYTMKKLIEQTLKGGNGGYPDFYYINGPILVMTKVNGKYYWMIDYPIKYNPENYSDYVNSSDNWNIAKTLYQAGRKLLNPNAPFIFFVADNNVLSKVSESAYRCMPDGAPQSNTDYYYPGCSSKSCLWGPDYGSGNWLFKS